MCALAGRSDRAAKHERCYVLVTREASDAMAAMFAFRWFMVMRSTVCGPSRRGALEMLAS